MHQQLQHSARTTTNTTISAAAAPAPPSPPTDSSPPASPSSHQQTPPLLEATGTTKSPTVVSSSSSSTRIRGMRLRQSMSSFTRKKAAASPGTTEPPAAVPSSASSLFSPPSSSSPLAASSSPSQFEGSFPPPKTTSSSTVVSQQMPPSASSCTSHSQRELPSANSTAATTRVSTSHVQAASSSVADPSASAVNLPHNSENDRNDQDLLDTPSHQSETIPSCRTTETTESSLMTFDDTDTRKEQLMTLDSSWSLFAHPTSSTARLPLNAAPEENDNGEASDSDMATGSSCQPHFRGAPPALPSTTNPLNSHNERDTPGTQTASAQSSPPSFLPPKVPGTGGGPRKMRAVPLPPRSPALPVAASAKNTNDVGWLYNSIPPPTAYSERLALSGRATASMSGCFGLHSTSTTPAPAGRIVPGNPIPGEMSLFDLEYEVPAGGSRRRHVSTFTRTAASTMAMRCSENLFAHRGIGSAVYGPSGGGSVGGGTTTAATIGSAGMSFGGDARNDRRRRDADDDPHYGDAVAGGASGLSLGFQEYSSLHRQQGGGAVDRYPHVAVLSRAESNLRRLSNSDDSDKAEFEGLARSKIERETETWGE